MKEVEEEKENHSATNIDDVKLSFEDVDYKEQNRIPPANSPPVTNQHPKPAAIQTNVETSLSDPQVVSNQNRHPVPVTTDQDKDKDQRKNAVDAQFQSMFLDSVPNHRSLSSSSQQEPRRFYPPPMMAKNGHNNNNNLNISSQGPTNSKPVNSNSAISSSFRDREGQLRRFVSPPTAPIVGGDEEKKGCCMIL